MTDYVDRGPDGRYLSETYEPELLFGECPCGEPLERPFWDDYCFACQNGLDDDEDVIA